jgi:hypothetical protein
MASPWLTKRYEGEAPRSLVVAAVVVVMVWMGAVALTPAAASRPVLLLVQLVIAAAAVAAGVATLLAAWRPAPRAPRVRVLVGVGFAVPLNRAMGYLVVCEVLLFGNVTAQAIDAWAGTVPNGRLETVIDRSFALVVTAVAVALGTLVVLMVVLVLRGRPSVELTPYGVVLRYGLTERGISWEEVTPDNVGVRPGFVTSAIRYYAVHADRRSAIGTHAEYGRLVDSLAGPSPATV